MAIDPHSLPSLNGKHPPRRREAAELRRDADLLRELVRGPGDDGERVRAFTAYVATGQPDASRLLTQVLLDGKESPFVRAAAASCLGRLGPLAEALLVEAQGGALPPLVRLKVSKALGRIAGQAAIPALERVAATTEDDVRRQAAFALQLVAHRTGLRELAIGPGEPEILASRELAAVSVREVGAEALRPVLDELGPDCFGLVLGAQPGYQIECRGAVHTLMFHQEGKALLSLAESATRRPHILGLLVSRAREDGSHSVSRIVLGGPLSDEQFYVAVHRTDGRLVHWGAGVVRGGEAEVSLRSVKTRGNFALWVRARVREGELRWEVMQAGPRIHAAWAPEPFSAD